MLKCIRIHISEGINVNKTNLSKECDVTIVNVNVTIGISKILVLNMSLTFAMAVMI